MRLLAPASVPVALLLPLASAQHNYKTWKDFGGGPDSAKFVNLTQTDKSNVKQLRAAWVYPVRDRGTYRFNPIIVDNVMFVLARNNSVVAKQPPPGKKLRTWSE